MILSEQEYLDMWVGEFQPYTKERMPPYHEYLQREVYQQDYLDLFIGSLTYVRLGKANNVFGIPLDLFPITIPFHPIYVIRIEGIDCLLVDYDFPFTETEVAESRSRSIKYVLIGEAANSFKLVESDNIGKPDELNSYFYNCNHILISHYFNAPVKAFGKPPILKSKKMIEVERNRMKAEKRERLIELAKEGMILLDLFPFAISYSDSLKKRIRYLAIINFKNQIHRKLEYDLKLTPKKLKFSFICNIDHAKGIILIFGHQFGFYHTTKKHWLEWANKPKVGLGGHGVIGDLIDYKHKLEVSIDDFKYLKEYRAMGRDGSGSPHEIPIRFSFDI